MKNFIPLLLLAGCASGNLPPENYDIVITEAKQHDEIIPTTSDAGVMAAVPPLKTWILKKENEPCFCMQGDPLCPCLDKP